MKVGEKRHKSLCRFNWKAERFKQMVEAEEGSGSWRKPCWYGELCREYSDECAGEEVPVSAAISFLPTSR